MAGFKLLNGHKLGIIVSSNFQIKIINYSQDNILTFTCECAHFGTPVEIKESRVRLSLIENELPNEFASL